MNTITPLLEMSEDGSHTLRHPVFGDTYHSLNGAVAESRHVYINAGWRYFSDKLNEIRVLEVGFGSGLNAALTMMEANSNQCHTIYHAVELYPVSLECVLKLNYSNFFTPQQQEYFINIHKAEWEEAIGITSFFNIKKINSAIDSAKIENDFYDVVYFDAFSADTQPQMWSIDVFSKIYESMKHSGVLVTYSAKGIVKRALRECGFGVERLEGAPGKRHMVRAVKY